MKVKKRTKIFFNNVFNWIEKKNILIPKFDIIFCDPPFKDQSIDKLIQLIFNKKLLNKNGIIILHRNKTTEDHLPNYFKILDERNYGIPKIIFGKLFF